MSRSRSLVRLLVAQHALLTCGIVLAFATSSLWLTHSFLVRQQQDELQDIAERLAAKLDGELAEEGSLAIAARALVAEESSDELAIAIDDGAGRRLANSVPLPAANAAPRRASARARSGARVVALAPARLGAPTEAALRKALAVAALPLLVVALALAWWSARRLARPLESLATQARAATAAEGAVLDRAGGVREIDAVSEAFNELLARLSHLLRAEKQFTADASHELRTPLTILSGELELALAAPGLAVPVIDALQRARDEVATLRDLVDAMLALRHAEGGAAPPARELEAVNVADVLREMVRTAGRRAPTRAADTTLDVPDELMVLAHPLVLAAGLRNLLDNALKFTAAGQAIAIAGVRHGGAVRVCVDDAGPGIAAHEREAVFGAFYRGAEARAMGGGVGLGLALARRIVRLYGGEVGLGTSPLGGTRVEVTLPTWETARQRPTA